MTIIPFGGNAKIEVRPTDVEAPGWITVYVSNTVLGVTTGFILNEDELGALTNALNEAMIDSYESKGATA